jgi:cold shock CspA family protein
MAKGTVRWFNPTKAMASFSPRACVENQQYRFRHTTRRRFAPPRENGGHSERGRPPGNRPSAKV